MRHKGTKNMKNTPDHKKHKGYEGHKDTQDKKDTTMSLRNLILRCGGSVWVAACPALLLATARLTPAAINAGASCESLAALALPSTTITLAEAVPAGGFIQPGARGARRGGEGGDGSAILPAFGPIAATLKPSGDSDIKIELWLPAANWNGKFQAVGNGAWNGTIAYPAMLTALRRGYAAGSTDTGHVGGSADFALGHPEKVIDFGSRAVHELAVKSKAVIA